MKNIVIGARVRPPRIRRRAEIETWWRRGWRSSTLSPTAASGKSGTCRAGAPLDEIRLLELSDRLGGGETNPEAIDFGLDVEGAQFHLSIADVSSEQLEQIQQDPARLPKGWSLDGKQVWPRRRRA